MTGENELSPQQLEGARTERDAERVAIGAKHQSERSPRSAARACTKEAIDGKSEPALR